MCGHVGVAGHIGAKEERVFKTLLRLDTLRGEDSTGVASMTSTGAVTISKDATNAYAFLSSQAGKKPFYGWNRIMLGHNRWATKGAVNVENAHPFEFGHIVGAHNGTLKNHHNLLDGNKFSVDSQAVFYHMSEESVEDLWLNLNGAAALVWINKVEKSINFLRNKERELYYTVSKDGKSFFWASEFWMLVVACAKEGVEVGTPVMFKENVHYCLNPDKMDMSVRELKPYAAPVYVAPDRGLESYTAMSSEQFASVDKNKGIQFEVDVIKDYTSWDGVKKANVWGVSAAGLPIRIYGIEIDKHEWLINSMATEDVFFEGKVIRKTLYQIEVDINTVFPLYHETVVVDAENDVHEFCCEVCGDGITKGKEVVQPGGKIFCQECNLDLLELDSIKL
ncbi:putative amidotransferase [Citrobacter phage CVT22]|uniref:Amidotransferase n=1 Tax=Citrobacter phage CVT22 TaxID=1622234 RepID=A0A0R6CFW0_9CAUD|nr:L-glutamine-D-fructose-6-phosphate aminotransferase [Citrobacter phage CVT22]AJT60766.1 putative amidotransferase [Citrobacter phage CVT22]